MVVVLDLSRSMFAEAASRVGPATACWIWRHVHYWRRRGGQRVALVVFAGKPRLACPLTHGLDHFREGVEAIDREVPDAALGGGTRIGAAAAAAAAAFDGRTAAARDVLLLSDGDDPARDGEWRQEAEQAHAEGVAVHCVGVGDPSRARSPPATAGWCTRAARSAPTGGGALAGRPSPGAGRTAAARRRAAAGSGRALPRRPAATRTAPTPSPC
ncbi:MAG: VWA domain-containing protein [Gemmataceae bacterium]